MSSNIIQMPRRCGNGDEFLRLCNSPAQQARRMEKRKAQRMKTNQKAAVLFSGLVSAGAILGFILGAMII